MKLSVVIKLLEGVVSVQVGEHSHKLLRADCASKQGKAGERLEERLFITSSVLALQMLFLL